MVVDDISYRIIVDDAARDQAPLATLCGRVFGAFDPGYLDRLASVVDPVLVQALHGDAPIGFKLGYRRGATLFYSWLGGVDPDWRRRGIAEQLTIIQHDRLMALGYATVETRTRANNNAMIILNLRSGFEVRGFEIDAAGNPVVTQRKRLAGPA